MGTQVLAPATSNYTSKQLHDDAVIYRAVEAAIWGMPAVNYDLMLQQMLSKTTGKTCSASRGSLSACSLA